MATERDRFFFIQAIFFFQELKVFSSMLPDGCRMAFGEKSGDGGYGTRSKKKTYKVTRPPTCVVTSLRVVFYVQRRGKPYNTP